MTGYKNGEVPREQLVLLASGTNADGYWEHLSPPGTARKIAALRKLGQDRHRRTLEVTPGWNIYRPLASQQQARAAACGRGRCQDAAVVGTSSHGLVWSGQITGFRLVDVAAIDFANGPWVFGSVTAFYAACREVGLVPGVFSWETWHVIDLDPWASAPAPASTPAPLEDFMAALTEPEQRELLDILREIRPHIKFTSSQLNLEVASDRDPELQAATMLKRVREILFALNGGADPWVTDANGVPVERAIAAFMKRENVPAGTPIELDEADVAKQVVAGLAQNFEALQRGLQALPDAVRENIKNSL